MAAISWYNLTTTLTIESDRAKELAEQRMCETVGSMTHYWLGTHASD